MSLDPKEAARAKFEAIVKEKKDRDDKANAVVWAAVAMNTGLGAVPFGVNVWTSMGVTAVMSTFIGTIYGHHLSHEGAGQLIKQIFASVGGYFVMSTLGLKFFAEVLKGAGVITIGGATAAGMALDAVLCGAITYALGFTVKDYMKKGQKMSKAEINTTFHQHFKDGKAKVREQKSKGGSS